MTKKELIESRKQEIINELGLTCEMEIEETLLNWFMQEFFIGEITRQELDEYAAEMGYQINLSLCGENELEGETNLC